MTRPIILALGLAMLPAAAAGAVRGHLDTDDLPAYLRDRGEGIALSQFGTYIQTGQVVVYPFFEHYRDRNFEYAPNELGYGLDEDYRGSYTASEGLLFVAFGVSDRLAIELEGAVISAELETAPDDPTAIPAKISESGIGDVEGQLRWRWRRESPGRAEVFSYFETVGPTQSGGSLIGTSDWEFKLGSGLTRGFGFGTMTARLAVEYDRAEKAFGLGEMAVEVLRRLSSSWRVYGGLEGNEDEIELITEAQWHLGPGAFLKLNNGFGVTSKATDWAPEVGVVFSW